MELYHAYRFVQTSQECMLWVHTQEQVGLSTLIHLSAGRH